MAITFKRNLSPFLTAFFADRAALNARTYNTHLAAEITLKNATVLRYATGAITIDTLSRDGASVAITPIVFSARLSGAPDVRHTQLKAPDAAALQLINLDYLLSTAIADEARTFEYAKVRLYLAFPKPEGSYEGIVLFDGFLDELSGDDEEASFTLIGDVSAPNAIVGREIPQRCMNELGDTWCGVPLGTLPVGAECTKIHDDAVGGCAYWGGVFNGVPYLDPTSALSGSGTVGTVPGDGGWDEPYPRCPCAETTLFPDPDGNVIHARDLKRGDAILGPGDVVLVVDAADIFNVPYRYHVKTASGAQKIVSATHRFLTGFDDVKGRACTSWRFDVDSLVVRTPKGDELMLPSTVEKRKFQYSFKPLGPGRVLHLALTAPHIYWAGMDVGYYIASHNLKDSWPTLMA